MPEQIGGPDWPHTTEATQAFVDDLAARIVKAFTPHAMTCSDKGCGPSILNDIDFSRYYHMIAITDWMQLHALDS